MIKRRAAIIVGGILVSFGLQGCTAMQEIQYQGKTRPVAEVEEMLSDYLESENPDLDFSVSITEDIE
jgi:hypothetical protein